MAIKRAFFLQTNMGHPDPWDDSLNLANVGVSPGLGSSNNAGGVENRIQFFQRVDNRFAITHSIYPEAHLALKKPYSMHDPNNEVPINFDEIANILDNHTWRCHGGSAKVVLMASVFGPSPTTQQDAIGKATYFIRNQETITDIRTGEIFEKPRVVPWFFCYKTDDTPLYYMVLNPYSVQCIGEIEGVYNENAVFTISNHLKNINDVVFKPGFSRNVRLIGDHNLVIKGNEFTVTPFGNWFVKEHLPGFFDKSKIKVDTNFDYQWVDGKIKVNTLNKQKGYFIIRWNTATGMDLIFHTSKNRFFKDYVVDIVD